MRNLKSKCLLISVLIFVLLNNSCKSKHDNVHSANKNFLVDIIYGRNEDWKGKTEDLKLDIYKPLNAENGKSFPLIVYLHGGGFFTGDKSAEYDRCVMLSDSGFIVACINYRLGWNKGTAACEGNVDELYHAGYRSIQDVNAALRFLVSKSNSYGIDTSRIFLAGSSAGAISILHAVYLNDTTAAKYFSEAVKASGSLYTSDNNLRNSYSIKGICSISGGLVDSNLVNNINTVPTIFFHGENDKTVPVDFGHYASCENYPFLFGSKCIYRQLVSKKIPAVAHILPNAAHGEEGESEYTDAFRMSNTACFFHSLMTEQPKQGGLYIGKENSCK
jgi:acetyl esterase/lipase